MFYTINKNGSVSVSGDNKVINLNTTKNVLILKAVALTKSNSKLNILNKTTGILKEEGRSYDLSAVRLYADIPNTSASLAYYKGLFWDGKTSFTFERVRELCCTFRAVV